jgi:LytS/YehU family sensor histidine kinase
MALLAAEAERERFARQGVQAELKLLQAQVEPHFLFNTLANLRFLVQTGSPHALEMLDHLIHYLRTALPEIRAESSTVGREIELARAYLEILRIRMGGALEIFADAPADLANVVFPPLVVLTLVENAIKHGIAPLGRGRVGVRAETSNGRLRVIVEDDGRGLVEPIGQGVGLGNVRERLRAIYGETARLELAGRPGGGTIASVEVAL